MTVRILQGDCIELMATLPAESVDAIVTDPPYGIRFMGKAWDGADIDRRAGERRGRPSADPSCTPAGGHGSIAAEAGKYDLSPAGMLAFQEFSQAWAAQALRVLKPGGHLLSFASTRTYHRMACGVEAAGFEIRDQLGWLFGSGFPKSHNGPWGGTALKPGWEPIVMARKPLAGTVEGNWLAYGTGALNIDDCRILVDGETRPPNTGRGAIPARHNDAAPREPGPVSRPHELGRWPANVLHDGSAEVLDAFPDAPGQLANASSSSAPRSSQNGYGALRQGRGDEPSADSANEGAVGFKMKPGARRLDSGSAARFFYCAKADKADRNEGLHDADAAPVGDGRQKANDTAYQRGTIARSNTHPTVKPTDLMRYLVRLVTPAGGTVLDPFMGSGSTLKAAELEGFHAIGMELDPDYVAIARRRIAADAPLFADVQVDANA